MNNPFLKKKNNKNRSERFNIFIWTLFDFANTSYSIIVVTFLYAVYFKKVVANGEPIGDFYWSIGTSASMLITAFISPILGAIADYSAGKKRFLLFFTAMCIVSTSLLYFVSAGNILMGLILFILANVGFEAGLVFYDSFLPEITSPKNYGRVSGYGFAMGYLGSLTTLAVVFPFIQAELISETFPISALIFLLFAAPLFIYLKDNRKDKIPEKSYLKVGFERVYNTITHIKEYKNLTLFLAAFFFYIEGVNTVIYFAGNYASTSLGFTMQDLIVFFIIVQTTAIFGSLIFGVLSDKIGQKKSLNISLIIWMFTIGVAYYTGKADTFLMIFIRQQFNWSVDQANILAFYFVGLLAGTVMGATQSTSRSLMSKLTPSERKTEFFGFYSLFGKSSAILGPLVFGLVSYLTGTQRIAILTINIFFVIGFIILFFVNDGSGKNSTKTSLHKASEE